MPHITPLLSGSSVEPTGGAETQIFLLVSELARRGHRLAVVTFPEEGLPDQVNGVAILNRPLPNRGRSRLVGKLVEVLTIWRTLSRVRTPVVVQRSAGFTTGAVALVARLRGARFIYSSANVADFQYEQLDPRWRNRLFFRLGVRLADTIVVQTPEQAELCRRSFGRQPVVIRSIAESVPPGAKEPEALLWVARRARYKRPYEFVELAKAMPEARFWMVAPGGEHHASIDVRELAAAVDGVPNLDLLAPRPRQALMELVDQAVAMVNTAEFEGMPNVYLEGWSRGVPALALFHDPDGVIEREGLGLFAGGSRAAFIDAARQLWDERADRQELSRRCRAYVEREHRVETVADRWAEVLGLAAFRA